MARVRNKITPEIAEEQCGFVKDNGTRNAIYMLRTLTERAIEIQRNLYLCFIDYTKAFDKLKGHCIEWGKTRMYTVGIVFELYTVPL